jgi:histidinol dehydrogenase
VREQGDDALIEFTSRFDGVDLTADRLRVSSDEISRSAARAPDSLVAAIELAIENVRRFHEPQRPASYFVDGVGGGRLGLQWRPVDAAALYVPGGRAAYPTSVIMNAVPAQVAGVRRLAAFTVPGMVESNPAVALALQSLGIDEVYRVAGAQAVAAAAFGTNSVPAVDVIVGPGNAYVAAAKREVFGRVGIDSVAGPSEVLILCDETADPTFVALDLLAQAEHDPVARCVVACTSRPHLEAILDAFSSVRASSPRRAIVDAAWHDHGLALLAPDVDALVAICAVMAPEHLQVILAEPPETSRLVAGAIFLGNHAPTALGDYIAGPNHVLPTGGSARFSGPLGVHTFLRTTTVVEGDPGMTDALAGPGAEIADYEQLAGHAAALRARLPAGAS